MDYAWITSPAEVIDRDHPDYSFWAETDAIERLIAEGESPAEDSPAPLPERPETVAVPSIALAVSREQAAALLSISVDTFERRVLPELRVAQVGRRQLVPVRELEKWLSAKTARALR